MTDYEEYRGRFSEMARALTDEALTEKLCGILDGLRDTFSVNRWRMEISGVPGELPQEAKDYLVSRKIEGLTEATIANKAVMLKCFFRMVPKPVAEITTNDVRTFLYQYQRENGISDRSLEGLRSILNSFWEWLVTEEILPRNVLKPIRPIRYAKTQRQAMDLMELEVIRSACKDERERALIEFLYSTGARVSETVGVKLTDVDLHAGTVRVMGKGRKERISYLNAKAVFAVKTYLQGRGYTSEYLFCSKRAPHGKLSKEAIEKEFRELRKRIGGELTKPLSPHIMRHTTATQALRAGMPIDQISKLLGHSDVSVTRIYAETNQDDLHASHVRFVV